MDMRNRCPCQGRGDRQATGGFQDIAARQAAVAGFAHSQTPSFNLLSARGTRQRQAVPGAGGGWTIKGIEAVPDVSVELFYQMRQQVRWANTCGVPLAQRLRRCDTLY